MGMIEDRTITCGTRPWCHIVRRLTMERTTCSTIDCDFTGADNTQEW